MGSAIANIKKEGVNIAFPLIESAGFGFEPDLSNNQIVFGLKGINGINTDLAQIIINNRPYTDINDFAVKLLDTKIVKKTQMVKLIKAGCFTQLHSRDRNQTMKWFLDHYVIEYVDKLTLAQLNRMKEWKIIPDNYRKSVQMISLKSYILSDEGLYKIYNDPNKKPLKRGYHDRYYILDDASQKYFYDFFSDDCVVEVVNSHYVVSEKKIVKEAESYLQPLREWFTSKEAIDKYNWALELDAWEKYALGNTAKWSMEALCYYDQVHELEYVDEMQYGIVNFFQQPETPAVYDWYSRKVGGEWKQMPKYKIVRIAGTVLHADNNHHTVTLLTKYGPVLVKMNKGHYAFYSKRISQVMDSGKKEKIEDSWLTRGNLLLISGIRREDQFWPMVYNDTIYKHTVNLITNVYNDGTLQLQTERIRV